MTEKDAAAQKAEVMAYFRKRYSEAPFSVVPGHWPDFKTKQDVDDYIDATLKIIKTVVPRNY